MTLKLHYGQVLDHLDRKPIGLSHPSITARIVQPEDKTRKAILTLVRPIMDQAERYLFDSGSDQDPDTVQAVKDTALAMAQFNILHLPHKVIWIEDPFDNKPDMRNYYLCDEIEEGRIRIHFFQRYSKEIWEGMRDPPTYMMFGVSMFIDLKDPKDDLFTVWPAVVLDPMHEKAFGEAVYSVKKFLVTLNTRQAVRHHHETAKRHYKASVPLSVREYSYTSLGVPHEAHRDAAGVKTGRRVPLKLVAGYVWGKNTRPMEEQKWIHPYWRGLNGEIAPDRPHIVPKRELQLEP